MEIEIISFGQVAEIIPKQRMNVTNIGNTDELKVYLEVCYPALKQIKYTIALNKNLMQENHTLRHNDLIAVMSPFSGG